MSEVNIKVISGDVIVNVGECCNNAKKEHIVRFINFTDIEIKNQSEPNYLNLFWIVEATNRFQTFGQQGQTNLVPADYEVFVLENTQISEVIRGVNNIAISGGMSPDFTILVRQK